MSRSYAQRAKRFKDKQYGSRQMVFNEEIVKLRLMPLWLLRPHESIDLKILDNLMKSIKTDGLLKKAIVVDQRTHIILDGHHRVKALEFIDCSRVPCLLIDYSSPQIVVFSWSEDKQLPKNLVIRAGLSGELLPPKTSKHMLRVNGHMVHISAIEPEVNMPLALLRTEQLSSSY
ncbi:ParB N-terminal domain-containing protein [Candidatus Bathyarchaeota archaeon]|nr:ParB N-terminal domain-containing protein [Candidatus Bathyarchaeota archaeon]